MAIVTSIITPKHGEQKNWRMEKIASSTEFTLPNGNAVSFDTGSEHSASERFCAICDKWVTATGVMGGVWCPDCKTTWCGKAASTNNPDF